MVSATTSEASTDLHCERQRANENARSAWQHEQRQEREEQRGGRAEHGDGDLVGRLDRGLLGRVTGAAEARDVFHHDDGVVDEQTERDDEADDRELIERVAEPVERRDADREREWDGDHHQQRRAKTERRDRQRDQRDGDDQIGAQAAEASVDVLGLLEAVREPHVARQRGAELRETFLQARRDVEGVLALLRLRRDEDGALAFEATEVLVVLVVPADVGDIVQVHGGGAAAGDGRGADFLERTETAAGLDGEAASARLDGAAGDVHVRGVDRRGDA
jgi:hypothetical protein